MHWVTEMWQCHHCGVEVGQLHLEDCKVRAVTSATVWQGPPLTPGMVPRVVAEGDVVALYLSCMHCEEKFKAGDVIFENRPQTSAIHGSCVLGLAQMIPVGMASVAEIEAEFEQRRAELLDPQP